MPWLLILILLVLAAGLALLRLGTRWGSTPEERARSLPGDEYFTGTSPSPLRMTRAITIAAPPSEVWPWIAQLGRGAGWYSIDLLDNGGRTSARHIVSWIPEPRLGDATTIGYLRHLDPERALAWWVDGVRFAGASARLVTAFTVQAQGQGSRLISRMSADAAGPAAPFALGIFRILDSIMACRQLVGIRGRVESQPSVQSNFAGGESGARDQYQAYEILYAEGDRAGIKGEEDGARWRQRAVEDGVITSAGKPAKH